MPGAPGLNATVCPAGSVLGIVSVPPGGTVMFVPADVPSVAYKVYELPLDARNTSRAPIWLTRETPPVAFAATVWVKSSAEPTVVPSEP